MQKVLKAAAVFAMIAFLAGTSLAADGGNPRKGKHLYKKSCKACHSSDGAGGELTPMSKTQAQWDRFFDKNTHEPQAWKGLSDKDLKDIQQFLYDHAADSPQPQTCG